MLQTTATRDFYWQTHYDFACCNDHDARLSGDRLRLKTEADANQ
jgi:hypothetical protein